MDYLAIIFGITILAYAYFGYYQRTSEKINMKVYLFILALGAALVGYGAYSMLFDMLLGKIILAVDLLLFLLAAYDAYLTINGKMTRYQKAQLKIIAVREEQERIEIERNKHFKDI